MHPELNCLILFSNQPNNCNYLGYSKFGNLRAFMNAITPGYSGFSRLCSKYQLNNRCFPLSHGTQIMNYQRLIYSVGRNRKHDAFNINRTIIQIENLLSGKCIIFYIVGKLCSHCFWLFCEWPQ